MSVFDGRDGENLTLKLPAQYFEPRVNPNINIDFYHFEPRCCDFELNPGAVASYRCTSGYSLKGSGEKTCLENGAWVPPTPISCVKDN